MRLWHRATAIFFATTLALISASSPSLARDRHWGHWGHGGWHHRHHHDGGDIVAAGIIGLALGAIIGGALSEPREPYYRERVYYDPPPPPPLPPRRLYRSEPRYSSYREYTYEDRSYDSDRTYGPPPPWTPEWYDYCEARHKSFDARSGTYIGRDRRLHFCE
jgi:hypothetical protein